MGAGPDDKVTGEEHAHKKALSPSLFLPPSLGVGTLLGLLVFDVPCCTALTCCCQGYTRTVSSLSCQHKQNFLSMYTTKQHFDVPILCLHAFVLCASYNIYQKLCHWVIQTLLNVKYLNILFCSSQFQKENTTP